MKTSNEIKEVCIGHLTLDDVVNYDGTTMFNTAGGAALYSAAGAALWSEQVGIFAKVGSDYAKDKIQELTGMGIDVQGLKKVGYPGISIWALYEKDGARKFIPKSYSGDYGHLAPEPDDFPASYREQAEAVHISPMPLSCQLEFLKSGWSRDKLVTLDPHYDWCGPEYHDEWTEIFQRVHTFLPSEDEIVDLMDLDGKKEKINDYKTVIEKIAAAGVRVVALKLGVRGILVFDSVKDLFFHVPSCAGRIVDVTGAGDAFAGGYLAGLSKGEPAFEAALKGCVSSSAALEGFGAFSMLQHADGKIERRLETLRKEFFYKYGELATQLFQEELS